MTEERIREIGEMLRKFGDYAQNSYYRTTVEIEEYDVYFDLGQFGEASTSVTLTRDDYEIDLDEVISEFPFDSGTMLELATELEEYEEEKQEASLDSVLTRMEEDGQGMLVRALRAVVEATQAVVAKASDMSGLSIGPLPLKPLPWPGAMRPEIDYTADDFPLRYQPPPGYDWAASEGQRRAYDNAPSIAAINCSEGGTLVMDSLGRARWYNREDNKDTYTEGRRWRIWYMDRDGIPSGRGFNGADPPRGFDADGEPIQEPGVNVDLFFNKESDRERTKLRVREIRLAYEQSLLPKNQYGVSYDPMTASLEAADSYVDSVDLRVGDKPSGFGRVVRVRKLPDGQFEHTFLNDLGVEYTDVRSNFNWNMKKIIGWNDQPSAFSLAETPVEVDYDPLTVPITATSKLVVSSELRLGDDITGDSFGRVTGIEDGQIMMNRDGEVNRTPYNPTFKWSVRVIDVPNRDSLPTIASAALLAVT